MTITQAGTSAEWGSTARTYPGVIQYYEGVASKYEWLVQQRTREHAYYDHILALAAAAKTEAASQTADDTHVMVADNVQNQIYAWPQSWGSFWDSRAGSPAAVNRFTGGADGSAHALLDKTTARDSSSSGSAFRMPNTRAQEADGWPVTLAAVDAAVNTRSYVTIWTDA